MFDIVIISDVNIHRISIWKSQFSFNPVAYTYFDLKGFEYFTNNKEEIEEWCNSNLNDIYSCTYNCVAFKNIEDAMAFKLRWS